MQYSVVPEADWARRRSINVDMPRVHASVKVLSADAILPAGDPPRLSPGSGGWNGLRKSVTIANVRRLRTQEHNIDGEFQEPRNQFAHLLITPSPLVRSTNNSWHPTSTHWVLCIRSRLPDKSPVIAGVHVSRLHKSAVPVPTMWTRGRPLKGRVLHGTQCRLTRHYRRSAAC